LRKKRHNSVAKAKRLKIIVEPLEPRTLFSADVVSASLASDLIADNSPDQQDWLTSPGQSEFTVSDDKGPAYPTTKTSAMPDDWVSGNNNSELIGFEEQAADVIAELEPVFEQSRQLIVIDARVDDSEALLQDVINNSQSGTDFDVIELIEGSDGIEQITSALNAQSDQDYDAVHIITHGSDAELQLGSTQLNSANLQQYQNELASWSSGLSHNADILLYGCDVAQTDHGQQFVDQISHWTGADIASSNDLTGHAELGGNWEFEYIVGSVETDLALSATAQHNWAGTLATGTTQAEALWITTKHDVNDSNAPGLSNFAAVDVVQIADPDLTLENGSCRFRFFRRHKCQQRRFACCQCTHYRSGYRPV